MIPEPIRLPDAATVAAVLAGLTPATADAELGPALTRAFPGFSFATAAIDDCYWRDTRTVVAADGMRSATIARGSPGKWPRWMAI
jgi:hypothetical protein